VWAFTPDRRDAGCDWYGSAVNVAARLAAQAEPNQALVLRGVRATVAAWRLA
jgi:class 3 adenylate cyclase